MKELLGEESKVEISEAQIADQILEIRKRKEEPETGQNTLVLINPQMITRIVDTAKTVTLRRKENRHIQLLVTRLFIVLLQGNQRTVLRIPQRLSLATIRMKSV